MKRFLFLVIFMVMQPSHAFFMESEALEDAKRGKITLLCTVGERKTTIPRYKIQDFDGFRWRIHGLGWLECEIQNSFL